MVKAYNGTIRYGRTVTLTDYNGVQHVGILAPTDHEWIGADYPGYGVHTIVRPDGTRFRTEGRLSPA